MLELRDRKPEDMKLLWNIALDMRDIYNMIVRTMYKDIMQEEPVLQTFDQLWPVVRWKCQGSFKYVPEEVTLATSQLAYCHFVKFAPTGVLNMTLSQREHQLFLRPLKKSAVIPVIFPNSVCGLTEDCFALPVHRDFDPAHDTVIWLPVPELRYLNQNAQIADRILLMQFEPVGKHVYCMSAADVASGWHKFPRDQDKRHRAMAATASTYMHEPDMLRLTENPTVYSTYESILRGVAPEEDVYFRQLGRNCNALRSRIIAYTEQARKRRSHMPRPTEIVKAMLQTEEGRELPSDIMNAVVLDTWREYGAFFHALRDGKQVESPAPYRKNKVLPFSFSPARNVVKARTSVCVPRRRGSSAPLIKIPVPELPSDWSDAILIRVTVAPNGYRRYQTRFTFAISGTHRNTESEMLDDE